MGHGGDQRGRLVPARDGRSGDWSSPEVQRALGVGFLGGFTTFSTFSVQAVLDVEAGEPGRALLYVTASVVLGIAAAAAGYGLARWIT